MKRLFVNACMREGSRTERIARAWIDRMWRDADYEELRIGEMNIRPLDSRSIATYNDAVAHAAYDDAMFDVAKQFAAADDILMAAPVWNYAMPARLHDYLELVCSQGVTFDVTDAGAYVSLCRAQRLTFVSTAGGPIPVGVDDHAFGYVRTLSDAFWHIPEVRLVYAESLDMLGTDVEAKLLAALEPQAS